MLFEPLKFKERCDFSCDYKCYGFLPCSEEKWPTPLGVPEKDKENLLLLRRRGVNSGLSPLLHVVVSIRNERSKRYLSGWLGE